MHESKIVATISLSLSISFRFFFVIQKVYLKMFEIRKMITLKPLKHKALKNALNNKSFIFDMILRAFYNLSMIFDEPIPINESRDTTKRMNVRYICY